MKQYLSWTQGRRDQGGVESLCLYVARFDPSAGTRVAHLPIECATVETLVTCLNANPADAAEVWRRLHPSSRCEARREGHEGHDAPCYYCGQPCNTYAGNPGLWPLGFTHEDEPGVVKWHHTGCVQGRLRELERVKAEMAETWNVIGGPPEHPEEDPEVSTLPAAVRVTLEYEREQLALAREHLKIAEQERDEYKLTTETIKAALFLIDATAEETVAEIRALKKAESRDGAALEKVRKLLGTTVAAEKVPEVLENTLRALSRPCGEDAVQPERASAEEVRDYVSRLTKPEPSGSSFCLYIDEDCDPPRPCRRRGWHSGPHTSSLNEARRLDAVVTHEDLKKLKAEIWDELIGACEAPVAVVGYPDLEERPYLKLGQIMRRERRRRS